jgi:hypothetical protein
MKPKRCILLRKIYKWKARLNCHRGQQEQGVNFWEIYSPVVNWISIRLFLVTTILKDWDTQQIDFVLAFPRPMWSATSSWRFHWICFERG